MTANTRPKLTLNPPRYPDNERPYGFLSNDPRSRACWHFYTLAQKQLERVGLTGDTEHQFGLLETDQWMDKHYEQTARTIAMIHGLDSPDDFAKAWDEVRLEAARCQLPKPHPSYTKLVPGVVIQ